jgi:hypothetical protein
LRVHFYNLSNPQTLNYVERFPQNSFEGTFNPSLRLGLVERNPRNPHTSCERFPRTNPHHCDGFEWFERFEGSSQPSHLEPFPKEGLGSSQPFEPFKPLEQSSRVPFNFVKGSVEGSSHTTHASAVGCEGSLGGS